MGFYHISLGNWVILLERVQGTMQLSEAELLADAASPELKLVNPAEKIDEQPCEQSNQHEAAHSIDAQTINKELSEQAIAAHESSTMGMLLCDRLERASLCVANMATATIIEPPEQDSSHYVPVVRSASVTSLTESALSVIVVSPTSAYHVVDAGDASVSASSISASLSAIATSSRIGSSGISEAFSDIDRDVSSIAASESDELSSLSSCSSRAPHASTRPVENVPCVSIQLEMHHLAVYDAFCPHILKDKVANNKRRRKNDRRKAAQLSHDSNALPPREQEPGDTLFPDSVFTCPAVVSISDPLRERITAPVLRMEDRFLGFDQLRGILLRFVHRRHLFLDLGCGTSDICTQLVLHGYNHVYGIDNDQAKVAFQRQQSLELGEFVRIQHMNAADMTFPDQFLDCVFTKAILDEIACGKRFHSPQSIQTELLRVVSEILRCVKPGGIWILVTCQTPQSAATQSGESPWWQWEAVEELIQHHALLEVEYHAGTPRAFGEKPFAIRVYRRSETATQRLRRVWLERDQELKSEAEIKAFDRWQQEKRLERAENASQEREARQMIQEDMESTLWTSIINYKNAKNARDTIRRAIFERAHEEERAFMVREDSLSTVMQAYVAGMLKQVDCIVRNLAAYAVESSIQGATQEERKQKIANASVTAPSEQPNNHHDWIHECVMNAINTIVSGISGAQPVSEILETSNSPCEVAASELPGTTENPAVSDPDPVTEAVIQQSKALDGSSGVKHGDNEMAQAHSNGQRISGSEISTVSVKKHEPTSNVVISPDCDQMLAIQTCIDMLIERAITSSEPPSILSTDNSAGSDPENDSGKSIEDAAEHAQSEIADSVDSEHQSAEVHSETTSTLELYLETETEVVCQQVIQHLVTSIKNQEENAPAQDPPNTTTMNL